MLELYKKGILYRDRRGYNLQKRKEVKRGRGNDSFGSYRARNGLPLPCARALQRTEKFLSLFALDTKDGRKPKGSIRGRCRAYNH